MGNVNETERLQHSGRWWGAGLAVIGLAVVSVALLGAQQAQPAQPAQATPQAQRSSPSMHQIFEEDQKDRMAAKPDWDKVGAHDAEHRKLVHQMLEAGTLQTGQDFKEASFIFQHGDKPEDYLLAHILAMAATSKGDANARWIAAATLDRYLQSMKQPQVFGTQYRWPHQGPKPDEATQEPYNKDLLSDAMRKEFCVTSLAGQQQNLEALNQGKDFPSPDHCLK